MIIAEIVEQINLQEKIEKKLNRKETKTLRNGSVPPLDTFLALLNLFLASFLLLSGMPS
jgi:hypothetical protein